MVSPEKNATTSRSSIHMNVENPQMRLPSRSKMTPSFSARSPSNRSRLVPAKYVSKSAYIWSRSAGVVRETTEPARRRATALSKRGDVDVDGTMIEMLIKVTSVGPRREIKTAGIRDVRIRARDIEQRIARIETDEEIVESTLAREVVDFAEQAREYDRRRCADQRRVRASNFFTDARQERLRDSHPSGVAANNRLLVCRLIPQPDHSDDRSASARNPDVLDLQSERTEIAERLFGPHRKKLAAGSLRSQKRDDFRNLVEGSRHDG